MSDSPKEGTAHSEAQTFHNSPTQSSTVITPSTSFSAPPGMLGAVNSMYPYPNVVLPPLGSLGGQDIGSFASTFPGILSSPTPFVRLLYPPLSPYFEQGQGMPGMVDANGATMAAALNLNPAFFGQMARPRVQLVSPPLSLSSVPGPYQTSLSASNTSSTSVSTSTRPMIPTGMPMPSSRGAGLFQREEVPPPHASTGLLVSPPPLQAVSLRGGVATSGSGDNVLLSSSRSSSFSATTPSSSRGLPAEIVHNTPTSALHLRFSSSTWQNRPTRIYLEAPELVVEPEELRKIASAPRHLVLSEQDSNGPLLRLISSSSDKTPGAQIFNYSENEAFFEMQVWHRAGKLGAVRGASPEPALILDAHSNSLLRHSIEIELQKLYCSKTELYCTINCNKGLKVQDLFLVCILRYGPHLLVSERTPFPSAHARKAGLSEASERIRSSPFETRRSASHSSSSAAAAASSLSSLAAESTSLLAAGAPLTRQARLSSPPLSYATLRSSLLVHPMGATIADKLELALDRRAATDDPNQRERSRSVFAKWVLANLEILSLELLVDALLLPFIAEDFLLPFLEDDIATRMLSLQPLGEDKKGVFMVYLSGEERPALTVAARYKVAGGGGGGGAASPAPGPPARTEQFRAGVALSFDSALDTPFFCIDSSPHRQLTRSSTLLGSICLFEQVSGWHRINFNHGPD